LTVCGNLAEAEMPRDVIWNSNPSVRNEGEELSRAGISLDDFWAYMPMHNYLYVPTRMPWPASSINARIAPIKLYDGAGNPVLDAHGKEVMLKARGWLDRFKPVEQMTWAPGLPMIIPDKLVLEGGWIEHNGANCFNLYSPPIIKLGDATKAERWFNHIAY